MFSCAPRAGGTLFHDPHKARPLTLLTSVARVWVRAPTSYSPFYGTPRVPSAVAGAREGGREEEEEEEARRRAPLIYTLPAYTGMYTSCMYAPSYYHTSRVRVRVR